MAYIGNTPDAATIIRVEARKSFALGVHVTDEKGKQADHSHLAHFTASSRPSNDS